MCLCSPLVSSLSPLSPCSPLLPVCPFFFFLPWLLLLRLPSVLARSPLFSLFPMLSVLRLSPLVFVSFRPNHCVRYDVRRPNHSREWEGGLCAVDMMSGGHTGGGGGVGQKIHTPTPRSPGAKPTYLLDMLSLDAVGLLLAGWTLCPVVKRASVGSFVFRKRQGRPLGAR